MLLNRARLFQSSFQCHALVNDGSLALCTASEQFNLVYLKNQDEGMTIRPRFLLLGDVWLVSRTGQREYSVCRYKRSWSLFLLMHSRISLLAEEIGRAKDDENHAALHLALLFAAFVIISCSLPCPTPPPQFEGCLEDTRDDYVQEYMTPCVVSNAIYLPYH